MSQVSTSSSPRLVLASASPRRRELLMEAGFEDFLVHPAEIDEDDYPAGSLPADIALFLARGKARAVAVNFPEDVVLAADTVVAFGDRPLAKPADADDARKMLSLLEGTTHLVITGVAVQCIGNGFEQARRVMSAVRMRHLTSKQINDYVASNDWQGKAGGYGIQDQDPFVTCVTGCHTNVVGLPMKTTKQLLELSGIGPRRANGSNGPRQT
jgi:septum formation protein